MKVCSLRLYLNNSVVISVSSFAGFQQLLIFKHADILIQMLSGHTCYSNLDFLFLFFETHYKPPQSHQLSCQSQTAGKSTQIYTCASTSSQRLRIETESDSDRIYCDAISKAVITALAGLQGHQEPSPRSDQCLHPDISLRC